MMSDHLYELRALIGAQSQSYRIIRRRVTGIAAFPYH